MLLTITTTQPPATDLSRLLLADPDDVRTCRFAFGEALVFFPQHDRARCTAAVLVQATGEECAPLASLAVAVATVFEPAIRRAGGGPAESEEAPRQFEVQAPSLSGPGHERHARRLFAPLGYDVDFGADGSLWLSGTTDLASLLTHLCVLLPVVEGARPPGGHEVVERLLAGAGGWLTTHPEYGYIAGQQPEMAVEAEPVAARHRRHALRMCTRHLST